MNIQQLIDLPASDDPKNPTWVNEDIVGVIDTIEWKKPQDPTKDGFWRVKMVDCQDKRTSIWGTSWGDTHGEALRKRLHQTVTITGKGIKKSFYRFTKDGKTRDIPQFSFGDGAEVLWIAETAGTPPAASQAPSSASQAPQASAQTQEIDHKADFHKAMRKMATGYLWALDYANKIREKWQGGMSDEHFQACTSSLFIQIEKQYLADHVPAWSVEENLPSPYNTPEPDEEPEEEPPPPFLEHRSYIDDRKAEAAQNRQQLAGVQDMDEDEVPF